MSVSTGKTVKWAVKPQLLCTKKVDCMLIHKVVDWVLRNSNLCESLIIRDTLLINEQVKDDQTRAPKLLLNCYMQELHNELIVPVSGGGLEEAKYHVTGELIISDTILRHIVPGLIRRMKKYK